MTTDEFLSTLPKTALLLVLGLSAGCATDAQTSVRSDLRGPSGGWLEASPQLREQIQQAAQRLPWTHGLERVELIQWFAQVGEPAYAVMLELAQDPRQDVSGAALAALGATRDSRLVEPLRALPWPETQDHRDLALERARTLVRLGDWEMLPVLIEGLRDERLVTRALCAQALFEATHERFAYDPRAEAAEREAAVARWESWWGARSGDPLLAQKAR